MTKSLRLLSVFGLLLWIGACSSDKSDKPAAEEKPANILGTIQDEPEAEAEPAKPAMTKVRVTGIPDENPTELQRKYAPMVEYLTKTLGVEVEYIPVTDYGAAVQALSAGKMDFAWLGGFTHVQARLMDGAVPICMRDIDREFKSVFIAHKDSGVKSPADLKGKSFAFGSKSSTSGHLMPRHFLTTEFKMDPKEFKGKPVYSGAHDATAKMVESGKVNAGALNAQVWERMVKENLVDTNKVSVIWTTPGYVDYVWTARKDVDMEMQAAFRKAFLDLDAANPEHKAVLDLQGAKEKFVLASPSDFDAIEAVGRSTKLLQ
jgi:phosphonate transport system substrate-binding protein